MNVDPKQLFEWVQLIGAVLAVAAAVFALKTYHDNVRLKRAEWIDKLHSKFFESPNYKRMRRILDYEPAPEFPDLEQALCGKTPDDELCECFVDYLNFFEYISSLWKTRQLTHNEIFMLFQYYLYLIRKHQFIWDYVRHEGFENLAELIERHPPRAMRG
jgi:hypothetical protein